MTTYNDAVRELYFWQYSNTGCFHNMLFSLMQKADTDNYAKLEIAFPEEAEAYYQWCKSDDYGNELFRQHGLIRDEVPKED